MIAHPGETIRAWLKARNMQQPEFAALVGISLRHVCVIINGHSPVTLKSAQKLERVITDIRTGTWLDMQREWNREQNQIRRGTIQRRAA